MESEKATDCINENDEADSSVVTPHESPDTLPADSTTVKAESTDAAEQVAIDYTPSGRNGFATVRARRGDELVFVDELNLTKAKARATFVKGVCNGADVDAGAIESELLKIADNLADRNGDAAGDKTELPDDEAAENASESEAGAATVELVEALAIDYTPSGRNGSATVTVRIGDDPIIVETVNLTREKNRAAFAAKVCDGRPGIGKQAVEAELLRIAAEFASKPNTDAESEATQTSAELLAKMPDFVRQEADTMLRGENLFKRIIDDAAAMGVAGERELIATVYLVGVSRLLDKPLAAIVQGLSSSGKSYVPERVASLFPPEAILLATQQTPQALFYMPAGSLSHRFVVAGERSRMEQDDAAEATRALREMLSSGKLSKLIPMKIDGRMETKLIEQDGPIAFIETTTLTNIFDEDANRCILVNTDERREQTRRIVTKLAKRYAGDVSGDAKRIAERHHAAQRMLQPWPVVIPFANRVGDLFDSDRVEVRRAFPQLMSMVQASALLHQFQRQIDDGRLLATIDDYQLARHLLARPFSRQLGGGLSDPARRYFERLEAWASGEFTTTDAKKQESVTGRAVTGWLSELADAGLVDQLEPHKGSKPARWKLTGVKPDDAVGNCPALPAVKDVFPDGDFRHSHNT